MTTTDEAASSSTTSSMSLPQAHLEAVTAYLQPLCAKHDKGVPITYEDLISSKKLADSVLALTKDNTSATVRIERSKGPQKKSRRLLVERITSTIARIGLLF